jgi:hypothetical protein
LDSATSLGRLALGIHPSGANVDPHDRYGTVWGEAATNVFVVASYQPQGNRGWFFTAGGGWVLFHNRALVHHSLLSSRAAPRARFP